MNLVYVIIYNGEISSGWVLGDYGWTELPKDLVIEEMPTWTKLGMESYGEFSEAREVYYLR